MIDRAEAIRRIKAGLKTRSGKDWSVTGGRGTDWGWITIDAPPRRRTWQHVQVATDPEPPSPGAFYAGCNGVTPPYRVGAGAEDRIISPSEDPWAREAVEAGRGVVYNWEVEDPSKEFGHMGPSDRVELAGLLGLKDVHFQGVSIAASSDYRQEYVDRAEGRTPSGFGKPYWD